MGDRVPPVYFYIPENRMPKSELPETAGDYWQWQVAQGLDNSGDYGWTVQTYLYLKGRGLNCELTSDLPMEGIVFSHRPLLSDDWQPSPKLLIVCIQGDRKRHPYAQLHVVQNHLQEVPQGGLGLWESHWIPYWPQPGLIPRDPERGDRFENVAFFGREQNLIHELCDRCWQHYLESLDLNWQIYDRADRWNDYSEVDVVVAIRKFGYNWDHTWKPANKLYNTWLAGVPAILGRESAYQAERRSDLDYLEVGTYKDLMAAIKQLKEDKTLRRAMADNALVRAQDVKPDKIVQRWLDFIHDVAVPAYDSWCGMSDSSQERFLLLRHWAYQFYARQRQLRFMKTKVEAKLKGKRIVGQQLKRDL